MTGAQLIEKVLADPQILWKKFFYHELKLLSDTQQQVVLQWFQQMADVSDLKIIRTLDLNFEFNSSCKKCTSVRSRRPTITSRCSSASDTSSFTPRSASRRSSLPRSTTSKIELTSQRSSKLCRCRRWETCTKCLRAFLKPSQSRLTSRWTSQRSRRRSQRQLPSRRLTLKRKSSREGALYIAQILKKSRHLLLARLTACEATQSDEVSRRLTLDRSREDPPLTQLS